MTSLQGKVALVTGAASGIGRATATALANEGASLIICDLNEQALDEVREEIAQISTCLLAKKVDVSSRQEMEALADEVHALIPALDILVNNAGVALAGELLESSLDDIEWVFSINVWGVIYGCKLFAPKMVERGTGGHIVNISSFMGYYTLPGVIGYSTSKWAVLGFSKALRGELMPAGIGVSVMCPGVIATNIAKATRYRGLAAKDQAKSMITNLYHKRNFTPDRVASAIILAIRKNKSVVPVSIEAWVIYHFQRLFPKFSLWSGSAGHALLKKRIFD